MCKILWLKQKKYITSCLWTSVVSFSRVIEKPMELFCPIIFWGGDAKRNTCVDPICIIGNIRNEIFSDCFSDLETQNFTELPR